MVIQIDKNKSLKNNTHQYQMTDINQTLKQLTHIIQRGLAVFCIIAVLLEQYQIAGSAIVGCLFSYLSFKQLIATQTALLSQQKSPKGLTFIRYLFRLAIYAVPLILGIQLNNYFNLVVILLSLFTFQVGFIIHEFIRNKQALKRRLT